MSDERRRKRKELRLVQNEASWLQKALFAMGKAEDAHQKLVDFRGDDGAAEYMFRVDESSASIEAIEEAFEDRLSSLKEKLRERRQSLR